MDHKLAARFVELLERQIAGAETAVTELHGLMVSQSQGQCLFDLYGEWSGAFSYSPGRREALQLFVALAKWLRERKRDHVGQLHALPEWARIVELRGPVDCVGFDRCSDCGNEAVSMGTSGFYDAGGLICTDCGNIYFKCYYDESKTPPCECGGKYIETWPCARCGGEEHKTIRWISPYEYFSSHSYRRGPGAYCKQCEIGQAD